MKCAQCQTAIPDRAKFCPLCGTKQMVQPQKPLPKDSDLEKTAASTVPHPESSPQKVIPVPVIVTPAPAASAFKENYGLLLGILSIVIGVIGFLFFAIIFGPAGLILGIIAAYKGNKCGWVGIAFGIINIFVGFYLITTLIHALQ